MTIPKSIVQDKDKTVLGLDGRKMSKSYGNIIPLLESEKNLRKSIMKIVTNSLEPGEPKDPSNCTVFSLYKYFASQREIEDLQKSYTDGISWGEAKALLYESINKELTPIRESYENYISDKNIINDLLSDGSKKVRIIAEQKISEIRDAIGINNY